MMGCVRAEWHIFDAVTAFPEPRTPTLMRPPHCIAELDIIITAAPEVHPMISVQTALELRGVDGWQGILQWRWS